MFKGSDVRPSLGRMARQALGGEPESNVVDVFRRLVVLPVARKAVGREGAEASTFIIRMAAFTSNLEMGTL